MERAESALQWAPDDTGWIRSYLVAEPDGSIGTASRVPAATSRRRSAPTPRVRGCRSTRSLQRLETLFVELDPVEAAT